MSSTGGRNSETDVNDDCMKHHREVRKKSAITDGSPSPPSYAVFEDQHGNLINRTLNVTWPARPHQGRYSLNEYKERKQRLKQRHHRGRREHRRRTEESSESSEKRQETAGAPNAQKRITDINEIFVGVRPASSLRSMLRPTEFRLFYMRPEAMSSFNQMPTKIPLMLAYMSASGTMYNFGFKQHELESGTFWQLDLNGLAGADQPIFRSMSALIKHYKSFVINSGDGKSDIFPVNE